MQPPNSALRLNALVCLGMGGCANTRDISSTPEYKPWIGKTVKLADPRGYNVFAPNFAPYFISTADGDNGYPIVAKLPDGYPVVIEAVNKTEGRYLIGNIPFWEVRLVLSVEIPGEKSKKRIRAYSELNCV